jgi:hypothetical protein
MIRTFALMAATAALAITPVVAQAAPARIAAPVADRSEELGGRSLILPIIIGMGLIIVLFLAIDSEEAGRAPVSP